MWRKQMTKEIEAFKKIFDKATKSKKFFILVCFKDEEDKPYVNGIAKEDVSPEEVLDLLKECGSVIVKSALIENLLKARLDPSHNPTKEECDQCPAKDVCPSSKLKMGV